MRADNVLQLKDFYETRKGRYLCRLIRKYLMRSWENVSKEKVIGFGFTLPYLPVFADHNFTLALMPQKIGALDLGQNIVSVLVDETLLPLRNDSVDKIICAHGFEASTNLNYVISELWRVMKPYGKIFIVIEKAHIKQEKLVKLLELNKFQIAQEKTVGAFLGYGFLECTSGMFGKYHIIEAQKLVFAPRGRTQKVQPTMLDKLLKPQTT